MANPTAVAARTTAILTGGGTPDYAADLDMSLTEDGVVTVEVTPTIGGLVSITLSLHAGQAATPTEAVLDETLTAISADLAAATGTTLSTTIRTKQNYFRAAITGAGGAAAGSDCVINYYYEPAAAASSTSLVDGGFDIDHA
jgi:hypothetical protein